jgi:hypothetical protein
VREREDFSERNYTFFLGLDNIMKTIIQLNRTAYHKEVKGESVISRDAMATIQQYI